MTSSPFFVGERDEEPLWNPHRLNPTRASCPVFITIKLYKRRNRLMEKPHFELSHSR